MRALAALLLVGCGSVALLPGVGEDSHAVPAMQPGSGTLSVVLFTSTSHGVDEGVASLVQRTASAEKDTACDERSIATCTLVPSCEPKSTTPAARPALAGSIAIRDSVGRTRVELHGEESKHGLAPRAPGGRVSIGGMSGCDIGA